MTNLKTYLSEMEGAGKEASQRPWSCNDGQNKELAKSWRWLKGPKQEYYGFKKEDAEFIVTAANNHDTLVLMVKRCVEALDFYANFHLAVSSARATGFKIEHSFNKPAKEVLADLERLIEGEK